MIPALILSEIEKRTGKKITELFDLLAGTSTGGIIAVGLNVNDPETGAGALLPPPDHGSSAFQRVARRAISARRTTAGGLPANVLSNFARPNRMVAIQVRVDRCAAGIAAFSRGLP